MESLPGHFDACLIATVALRNDARTLNIARTLVKAGKRVAVIAYGEDGEKESFLRENIHFIPLKKRVFSRAWKEWIYVYFRVKKLIRGVRSASYWAEDVFALPVAAEFAKRHKAKLFYDSREIYSALGSLGKRPYTQRLLAAIERYFIASVDEIFVSGRMDAEYLEEYFGWKKKIHLVMNLPPYRDMIESNLLREHFAIPPDRKILLYQGMLLHGRGIMPALRALPYLENCVLCLVGDGNMKEEIRTEANRLGVEDRVLFTGMIGYDRLHEWTSSADLGLCLIEPVSLSYRLALPNKIFEYIMARVPVLASELPALERLIGEYRVGELIAAGAEPQDLARTISLMLSRDREYYLAACDAAAFAYSREAQEHSILSLAAEI